MWIFEKSGTAYVVRQLINESASLGGIRLSEDKKEIFVGSNNSKFLIYRDNGLSFTLNQAINIGFQVFFISHVPNKLEINGFSSDILFLEFDGTEYKVTQTITTLSSFFGEIIRTEDFSRFLFGGSNLKIQIYEDQNGTYRLTE